MIKIPFFNRETKAEKQARIAEKEARLLAKTKSWERFCFRLKIVAGGALFTLLLIIGSLIGLGIYVGRVATERSNFVSREIAKSPAENVSKSMVETGTAKKRTSSRGFIESEQEKEYERKHGVEIVHLKDGKTYTRKSPKKK